jgi:anti-sigma regulatory factor (Ser/Thr protein kinase)
VLVANGMEKLSEAAQLVVSELVTNACIHVHDSVIAIECEAALDVAIVAVWDESPVGPEIRLADIDAEGGRGLLLVASLSDRWGWYECLGGKTVWAEVSRA